ncbi:tetratricopeptide repeat protein [uncultured Hyphomicrobium sp.]|uniref:tetratricopeptide repeat protein n=1 Tax=uncultured Hyphomicrobium sp. TaxID=194373 RepID=UPI0026015511|nr:tetratricopeptide repeat protein [uncultured Hyphomicrobium sp.]
MTYALVLAAFAVGASAPVAYAQVDLELAPPPGAAKPEGALPAPKPSPHAEAPPGADKGADKKAPPAETGPEQRAKLLDELYTRLATAPDQATSNEVAAAIEQLWAHSGSPTADLLVARASAAAEAQNRELAMKLLNAAVELQPDFAEAWNRRAYLYYLDNDFKRALGDLRRVLALDPRHFKALEGLGNLLQNLGEKKAALEAYESVLKVNPNAADAKKARDDLKVEVEGQGI